MTNTTSLAILCKQCCWETVLDRLKDPDSCDIGGSDDIFDATPLIWACWFKGEKVAKRLLNFPDKCNIDHVDSFGGTALAWACYGGLEDVALLILDYCDPKMISLVPTKGTDQTAIVSAKINNMKRVLRKINHIIESMDIFEEDEEDKGNKTDSIAGRLGEIDDMGKIVLII